MTAVPVPDRNRDLAGKVALITGGGSGLGLAMTRRFAARGAKVVVLDRDAATADALAGIAEASFVACDVCDPEAVNAAFDRAEAGTGPLDIVVANAGISQNSPTLDLSFADWRKVMGVNLDGVFLTAQAAGRRMVPRGRGVILLMASMYGVVAAPERIGYCVSKSGVAMMAKALALEWARHGLRVNALAPGYVRTPFVEDLIARGRLDSEALMKRMPIGRFIDTAEVADLAAFLASDEASAITGQVAGVDGGWSANGYL
ncbi:SDR family NAD(P)-dependent oxidoreductase [Bosea sp. 124]|uniref:SDR family NAD(P)-dependent oxidoreductase n=1 Tax=Bosea sp. 124 TaxID=2135642 RepID=UPI000D3AA961|nr:SDR family NAD(P)-dependent oxidoreductase [Bosea sp. 124]PTM43353.1 NAD(P)-dependent dehydrogenase (short-subunit alcohol dehydrogenase family) [Bosea sp. 124]